jgi:hypothetical protein
LYSLPTGLLVTVVSGGRLSFSGGLSGERMAWANG